MDTGSPDRSRTRSRSTWRRVGTALKHPIGAALLAFFLTGIAATLFSKWLDELSKAHELEIAAQRRAIESVADVTNLLYERRMRASMLASAISRGADVTEIRDRKKLYDDVFVRYNATLQSNMFRIREIFHTSDYTRFESLLEGPVHVLFAMDDACLTASYDAAISKDAMTNKTAKDTLSKCPSDAQVPLSIKTIHQTLLDCEYAYTDALYRIVRSSESSKRLAMFTDASVGYIEGQCTPH
jgi:hypothetical protein